MLAGRRRRKALLTLGVVIAGLLAIWLSLPVWFPWVLRSLASRANAHFGRYVREGYDRFTLYSFGYTNQSIRFQAQRIEGLTPMAWLARLAGGPGKKEQPLLSISGWQLASMSSAKPPKPVYSQAQSLAADFHFMQRWVPQVVLSNGTMHVEDQAVRIPALTWSNGQLWARCEMPKLAVVVTADVSRAPACRVQISSDSLHLESTVQVSMSAAALTLQSTNRWWDNPVELQARFGRAAELPDQATLQARNFQLAARLLQLPGYGEIRGSTAARWERGRFDLDLSAGAEPLAAQTNLPPLTLKLHVHGNTNRTVIDQAVISSPWLRAVLSRELAVHFTGGLLRQPASLKLTADLTRQPWLPLSGTLNGEAQFSPSAGRLPTAQFQLAGNGVGTPQLKATSFSVEGGLDWPTLTIAKAKAIFEDGSTASLSGEVALEQKRVESGQFAFSGPLVRRWLPDGYSYQGLTVAGKCQGAFTNLNHHGHLAITNLMSRDLRPLDLVLDWEGRQRNLSEAKAEISAGGSSLQVEGAMNAEDSGVALRLDALTLRQSGQAVLKLATPAQASLRRSKWTIDSLHWAGAGGELKAQGDVDWPRSGTLELSARTLSSRLLHDFLKADLPVVELRALNLSAGWSNGPVRFALEASAGERGSPAHPSDTGSTPTRSSGLQLGGEVKVAGDAKGISVTQLDLTSQGSLWATIHGFIPLTLRPTAPRGLVEVEPNDSLRLSGTVQSQGRLPDRFTAWTGIRLSDPQLHLEISGTPKEPQGQVQLEVRQIRLANATQPLPALTNLRLDLRLDRRQARLADCRLLVQGQPVALTGEVPLNEGFWSSLKSESPVLWEKASAHLEVAQAKLAALAELYPELMNPQGQVEADVSLTPGFKLNGFLRLQGARTRALRTLGPIRDIAVNLKFRERVIEMESATANVGGATVHAVGQADLGEADWLASVLGASTSQGSPNSHALSKPASAVGPGNKWPQFAFSLSGTNVPLARQPEVIIRSDLDLAVTRTNDAPPLLSGTVRLHDCFFLSDLTALLPGKVEAPSRRPPYFSITNAFLADWRLGVKVTGDRCLKARTTLFNGEASANVRLEGSLANPLALGDVRIDSGVVRFPFGSLDVRQGFVALTSENPYHPQLSVTATSRQFGYDITMQVSGTADAPLIQFSSSPPLSSEQILLLLTAGEMPQGTFNLTPQQRAQTLAMFLAQDLLTQLGFGGGPDQWLTIHSGEQITQTGKPTYSVEFKLTDKLSLVGEYDRFGDYNAGVKWRIYSK